MNRHPRWLRAGALALTALIFWADAVTPPGVAVPVLYVAPILLFMRGGEYWEPLLVAAAATLLIVLGIYVTPPGEPGDRGHQPPARDPDRLDQRDRRHPLPADPDAVDGAVRGRSRRT